MSPSQKSEFTTNSTSIGNTPANSNGKNGIKSLLKLISKDQLKPLNKLQLIKASSQQQYSQIQQQAIQQMGKEQQIENSQTQSPSQNHLKTQSLLSKVNQQASHQLQVQQSQQKLPPLDRRHSRNLTQTVDLDHINLNNLNSNILSNLSSSPSSGSPGFQNKNQDLINRPRINKNLTITKDKSQTQTIQLFKTSTNPLQIKLVSESLQRGRNLQGDSPGLPLSYLSIKNTSQQDTNSYYTSMTTYQSKNPIEMSNRMKISISRQSERFLDTPIDIYDQPLNTPKFQIEGEEGSKLNLQKLVIRKSSDLKPLMQLNKTNTMDLQINRFPYQEINQSNIQQSNFLRVNSNNQNEQILESQQSQQNLETQSNNFEKIDSYLMRSHSSNSHHQQLNGEDYGEFTIAGKIRILKQSSLMIVADGHGPNGDLVSQAIINEFPSIIKKEIEEVFQSYDHSKELNSEVSKQYHTDIRFAIQKSYKKLNQTIKNQAFDVKLSGATLTTLLIIDNFIYCGNVGDSKAILLKSKKAGLLKNATQTITNSINNSLSPQRNNSNSSNINNQVKQTKTIVPNKQSSSHNLGNQFQDEFFQLTIDHKPEIEQEYQRIERMKGDIRQQISSKTGQYVGPLRVWLKNRDFPGLAMTRSIGDRIAHSVGVISIPDVTIYKMNREAFEYVLVSATDGIWDVITPEKVKQFL
eukprot:403358988